MNKLSTYTLLLLVAMLLGCTADPDVEPVPSPGEGETWVTLDFGARASDKVQITTRATLGPETENLVTNFYIFIFDNSGNRVYGNFFDRTNLLAEAQLDNATYDSWSRIGSYTHRGKVRMKVPKLQSGSLYFISNLDTDMTDMSPERFILIQTLDELRNEALTLNQNTTSRNGSFPMTGHADVTIGDDITLSGGSWNGNELELERIDAKIEVVFRAEKGAETTMEATDGGAAATAKLANFKPESWEVINIPLGSYIIEREVSEGSQHDYSTEENDAWFNSEPIDFEDETLQDSTGSNNETIQPQYGFSFYMFENRPKMQKSVDGDIHMREMRKKTDDGKFAEPFSWEYAPNRGTYIKVKGEVEMEVNTQSEAAQMLRAEVTYYIHLGDFNKDPDNYEVCRNTHYKYTVTIKGVKNIQIEVEKNEEKQPGAEGDVYVARSEVYTFDAHYGQRVFAFDAEAIKPETMTWYVKTPFGQEGMPKKDDQGNDIPEGLDYKWVWFHLNDKKDYPYSDITLRNNRSFPGDTSDKLMDVIKFSKLLRDEKRKFDADEPSIFTDPNTSETVKDKNGTTVHRIYATVYVDEFYYETHPITGEASPTLWKSFVNQPNRLMHILSDTHFSKDEASSTTGSVVTIRQRAIQSIYDTSNSLLQTAWGTEVIDETEGKLRFFNKVSATDNNGSDSQLWNKTDNTNGLRNTLYIWNLIKPNNSNWQRLHWSDYLDYTRENDHELLFLKDENDKATARYTCMMRNRDSNGNGVIDRSEVRWYIASLQQITALNIGSLGLTAEAQFYNRHHNYGINETNALGSYKWRTHIITSTKSTRAANKPTIVWAEEGGASTSAYGEDKTWNKQGVYTVRCVRNLGMESLSYDSLPALAIQPNYVNGESDKTLNTVYRFDMSNINKKSLRSYTTTKELIPGDEYSESARVYSGFETGPYVRTVPTVKEPKEVYRDQLKPMLDRNESPCPDGYRVPNIREANIMSNYITNEINPNWWPNTYLFVSTFYAFGPLGRNFETSADKSSWYFTKGHITIERDKGAGDTSIMGIRCVKDVGTPR